MKVPDLIDQLILAGMLQNDFLPRMIMDYRPACLPEFRDFDITLFSEDQRSVDRFYIHGELTDEQDAAAKA